MNDIDYKLTKRHNTLSFEILMTIIDLAHHIET
jgi:hypothetical protein